MPVDKEAEVRFVVRQVTEIGCSKLSGIFAESRSEQLGILQADAKRQERSAVADHGVVRRRVELPRELVTQRKTESIFSRFRQHDRGRWRRERLKLVEVQVVVGRNLWTQLAVEAAIEYIQNNPVRRGVCQRSIDWKCSSARWYAANGQGEIGPDVPILHGLRKDWTGYEWKGQTYFGR